MESMLILFMLLQLFKKKKQSYLFLDMLLQTTLSHYSDFRCTGPNYCECICVICFQKEPFSALTSSQFSSSFSLFSHNSHFICANREGANCKVCGFDFFSWSGYETGSGYFRVCLVMIDYLRSISSKEALLQKGCYVITAPIYLTTDLWQSCLNTTLLLGTIGCSGTNKVTHQRVLPQQV